MFKFLMQNLNVLIFKYLMYILLAIYDKAIHKEIDLNVKVYCFVPGLQKIVFSVTKTISSILIKIPN